MAVFLYEIAGMAGSVLTIAGALPSRLNQDRVSSRTLRATASEPGRADLFFQVTTNVALYPEALPVLDALGHLGTTIVSNAD
jgi:hypothetical protein